MRATTLSFDNMHTHGELFTTLLRTRKQSFVLEHNWDMPVADGMEYDQYDSPASRWIAVHENGNVLGGVRLTPTTAKCGIYSYMIRDAQSGLLDYMPKDLLHFDAPTAPHIWEASRMFISKAVPKNEHAAVKSKLIKELVKTTRVLGATQIIGIMPTIWPIDVESLGIDVAPAGPKVMIDGIEVQVALMIVTSALN